jgi:hypothetical protein
MTIKRENGQKLKKQKHSTGFAVHLKANRDDGLSVQCLGHVVGHLGQNLAEMRLSIVLEDLVIHLGKRKRKKKRKKKPLSA